MFSPQTEVDPSNGPPVTTAGPAGALLEGCRQYLTLVASQSLGRGMASKADPSDLVQETFLEAQRHLAGFRGRSREELLVWLRRILECRVSNARRRFLRTKKRAAAREVGLDTADSGQARPAGEVIAEDPSPSEWAMRKELAATVEIALGRLPDRYRQVVRWRQQEQITFPEIGERLRISDEAARKLWGRAIVQLRQELDGLV